MSNEILTTRDGDVTHVTLNRPDDGNGVTNEMAVELTQILAEAGENSHFVTLRGAGADFCKVPEYIIAENVAANNAQVGRRHCRVRLFNQF